MGCYTTSGFSKNSKANRHTEVCKMAQETHPQVIPFLQEALNKVAEEVSGNSTNKTEEGVK